MSKLSGILVRTLGGLREFASRRRNHGWANARTYARCGLTNYYLRQRRKLARMPRVECPICSWTGFDFLMYNCGSFAVPHVECPHCHSQERHRMLFLYLKRERPDFFTDPGLVLHFAPEHHVRQLINANPQFRCLSTDYAWHMVAPRAGKAIQADMQYFPAKTGSFDLIFCLHVLEHVPDNRKGIAELARILKPGGTAYIIVPFMLGLPKTVEFGKPDPTIFDHYRAYSSADFRERLEPFDYEEVYPLDFLSQEEIARYRIPHDSQVIFRCSRK